MAINKKKKIQKLGTEAKLEVLRDFQKQGHLLTKGYLYNECKPFSKQWWGFLRARDQNRRQAFMKNFCPVISISYLLGEGGSSGFLETGITNIRMSPNFNSNRDNTS